MKSEKRHCQGSFFLPRIENNKKDIKTLRHSDHVGFSVNISEMSTIQDVFLCEGNDLEKVPPPHSKLDFVIVIQNILTHSDQLTCLDPTKRAIFECELVRRLQ